MFPTRKSFLVLGTFCFHFVTNCSSNYFFVSAQAVVPFDSEPEDLLPEEVDGGNAPSSVIADHSSDDDDFTDNTIHLDGSLFPTIIIRETDFPTPQPTRSPDSEDAAPMESPTTGTSSPTVKPTVQASFIPIPSATSMPSSLEESSSENPQASSSASTTKSVSLRTMRQEHPIYCSYQVLIGTIKMFSVKPGVTLLASAAVLLL